MKRFLKLFITPIILTILFWPLAGQAVPSQMTYTGYLEKGGKPFNSGGASLPVTFKIFEYPTGGLVPLWDEKISGVAVTNGVFTVVLGNTKPLSSKLFNGKPYYLEVVLGAQTMSPRLPVRTVPYAFTANNCIGEITPKSVSVGGQKVIDQSGKWVGWAHYSRRRCR